MSTIPRPLRRSRPKPVVRSTDLTIVSDQCTLVVPAEAQTLEGFRQWATADVFPEGVRVSFLEGEIIVDMSNEEMEGHVNPKGEITRVVMNLVKELRLGKAYADGLLLTNPDAGISNNPDALFFTYKSLETGRVRPVAKEGAPDRFRELEGTPDWVLEVISDTSEHKDLIVLRDAYHRAGIAEYWIVDARGDEVVFQILSRRKNGYVAVAIQGGWQRSKVFGRTFRLDRTLDPVGLLEYTLSVGS